MYGNGERSRSKNSVVGLSNLQMRDLNNAFANIIDAGLGRIHQKLDEFQASQLTHLRPASWKDRPRRLLSQFEVQEFCDNFEQELLKTLMDVSKSHKKSTSTRAPIAEPSIFMSEKPKGKSENKLEELKDFSDSLPIYDEYDEDLLEGLIICEDEYDLSYPKFGCEFAVEETNGLTCFEPEHPSSLVLVSQDFDEDHFNFSHQGPPLDTKGPLDDGLCPILDEKDELGPTFDEEVEHGPIFDEEATITSSIDKKKLLCFDPGTTPTSLPRKHCEKLDLLNSLPEMFVKISTQDVIRFGFDRVKEFHVSDSVFENMLNSFKVFEPDKISDQKHFQNGIDIHSELVLSFDQFLKYSKGFDQLESLELDLQQTVFCARKPFDSFVFKQNCFGLNSCRHKLITGSLFASTCALDKFMLRKVLKHKSPSVKTDFCESDLKLDILCVGTDTHWLVLRSLLNICVTLSFVVILVYNTFFEKHIEPLINDPQSEHTLLCSDFGKDRHVLKMINISCVDAILICNAYFDVHFERLKRVLQVLWKNTLISDLNKYMSCTYDPGILMFVLSVQEKQFQTQKSEGNNRAYHLGIWRCMVVQTGHLGDASDRGSVQEEYLGIQRVFCHESNFHGRPTHQGITEAWNYKKSFTWEEVMNFTSRRFPMLSICENQIVERDSSPIKKRPEPKPIIRFKIGLSAFQKDRNQEKWSWNYEVMVHSPKPARSKTKQLLSLSHETRGNSKTSTFICANESVKCHGRNQVTKDVLTELTCFLSSFHSDGLRENQTEKAPKGSAPEKLMEQSARTKPKANPQPTLCHNQEHFVLKVQDKHDQSPIEASTGGLQRIYKPGTWRWKYLRKINSKLQGSFCPKFSFIEFYMTLKFILSDLFTFDSGKMDLRSNPFEEGGNDAPWIEHRPARVMDTTHRGDLVNQLDQTKVFPSNRAECTIQTVPPDHPVRNVHAETSQNQDQYMEPDQNGGQTDQISSPVVRPSDCTEQADRVVYRIDPRSSGSKPRPGTRPDDGIDRPISLLSRPIQHSKTDSQAGINLGRDDSKDGHNFSIMALFVRTAWPEGCPDVLASVTDPIMDFFILYFTKAWRFICLMTCVVAAHILVMKINRQVMWQFRRVCVLSRVRPDPSHHGRTDDQTSHFNSLLNFYGLNFSKSIILELSEGLVRVKILSVHDCLMIQPANDRPCVLLLPSLDQHDQNEPGQYLKGHMDQSNKDFRALTDLSNF